MIWVLLFVPTVLRGTSHDESTYRRILAETHLRNVAIKLMAEVDNLNTYWELPDEREVQ